uniref:Uncharacterized protein n=1 Tax=Opuntia streptacantha TaxID=393608 RepID=A0A7C8Z3V2_OPUST
MPNASIDSGFCCQHVIYKTKFHSLSSGQETISVCVILDFFKWLTGKCSEHFVNFMASHSSFVDLRHHLSQIAPPSRPWLMDHNAGIWHCIAHPLFSTSKEKCSLTCNYTKTNCPNFWLYPRHAIINC